MLRRVIGMWILRIILKKNEIYYKKNYFFHVDLKFLIL